MIEREFLNIYLVRLVKLLILLIDTQLQYINCIDWIDHIY